MNRDDIVALFARRADAWARRDAAALAADHAETGTADSPMQGRLDGRQRIHEVYAHWFASFPDLVFTSKTLLIDGDQVAQFFNIRGTQSAPFGGVPATGRHRNERRAALHDRPRRPLRVRTACLRRDRSAGTARRAEGEARRRLIDSRQRVPAEATRRRPIRKSWRRRLLPNRTSRRRSAAWSSPADPACAWRGSRV